MLKRPIAVAQSRIEYFQKYPTFAPVPKGLERLLGIGY
jgi:hypothetical protein